MGIKDNQASPFIHLSAYDTETNVLNVIVDTPKDSRNKFRFDEKMGMFKLGGVLPAGAVFPFDFGYVPSTRAGDGDPLDVLLLMDEPAFVGCVVGARLIGVIEAEQTEQNDRLIAVAEKSRNHKKINSLDDVSENLIGEIEHFFVSYNAAKGKEFRTINRSGAERAAEIIKEGMALFQWKDKSAKKPLKKTRTKKR